MNNLKQTISKINFSEVISRNYKGYTPGFTSVVYFNTETNEIEYHQFSSNYSQETNKILLHSIESRVLNFSSFSEEELLEKKEYLSLCKTAQENGIDISNIFDSLYDRNKKTLELLEMLDIDNIENIKQESIKQI